MEKETATLDPSLEPEDILGGESSGLNEAKETKDPAKKKRKADPSKVSIPKEDLAKAVFFDTPEEAEAAKGLIALVSEICQRTPREYPAGHYISTRISDTGRTLTRRQSVANRRTTDYVMSVGAPFESTGSRSGTVPCHRDSHTVRWLLDRWADLLEVCDGKEKEDH